MTLSTYKKVGQNYQVLTDDKYYYSKDQLGSITRITSQTGAVVEEYTYNEFGKPYRWNGTKFVAVNGAKSSIGNTRMFTGREYDREIMLYFNRARYYDPSLGRFISRDPIGINDDVNLYSYVGNSPVGSVDRMGMAKILIIIGIDRDGLYPQFDQNGNVILGNSLSYVLNLLKRHFDSKGVKYDLRFVDNFSDFDKVINEKKREGIIIIGHGDPESISLNTELTESNNFYKSFHSQEVVDAFISKRTLSQDTQTQEQENNFRSTDVVLFSCSTGDDSQGKSSIAETLLDHYKFHSVEAPTKDIHIDPKNPTEYDIYNDENPTNKGIMKLFNN